MYRLVGRTDSIDQPPEAVERPKMKCYLDLSVPVEAGMFFANLCVMFGLKP
jgi:hypothetical protein